MAPGRPAVFKLLCDQTNGSIAVFEEVVRTGMGTPLHIHHNSDKVIHIYSGHFIVRLDEVMEEATKATGYSFHAGCSMVGGPSLMAGIFQLYTG